MQKKLTLTIDENVYYGLRSVIGERKISKFIENLVRPYVVSNELALAYQNMSKDIEEEQEAEKWIEGLLSDGCN